MFLCVLIILERKIMANPLVTVVTATTCSSYLKQNLDSVKNQTYENIQHLVVIDGVEHTKKSSFDMELTQDVIVLPYATGINQYNGHKIYAASTYLAKGEYIMYLDEDNWIEPDHIESLMQTISPHTYACSLRKITNMNGDFICNDDCESLGNWESVLGDYFVDVNCFFLPHKIALQLTPLWYRRARHPQEQPEVDRLLTTVLKSNKIECRVTGKYTVNYRAGNRADSVQPEFFIHGNETMNKKYEGIYPWKNPV
jgi:glycosyltransferase involved in cell wall biosynthesis